MPPRNAAEARVTARQRGWALATVAGLLLLGAVATPFAGAKLPGFYGFMPAFGASMLITNLLLATLLFSRGAFEERGDAARLGAAYLFVAAILVPYEATFPDALRPGTLISSHESAIWLWAFWHIGFGLAVTRYAWMARRPEARTPSLVRAVAVVALIVGALAWVAIGLLPYLPATSAPGGPRFSGVTGWIPALALAVSGMALLQVCRLRANTLGHLWLAVAMVAAMFDIWLTWLGFERFSLGWYLAKCGSMVTAFTVLVTQVHGIAVLHNRLHRANAVLTGLAHQDGLTGLCNRRHLDERISVEWRRSGREQQPLSLLMIDVDYFKAFNDRYGHLEGDQCLRRIAEMLRGVATRPSDTAARYGGEEFMLLLPCTDATGALEIAHRVKAGARDLAIDHAGSPLGRVTVSVGMATAVAEPGGPLEALVAEADRGVYRAKSRGRDQACWADDRQLRTPGHCWHASATCRPELSTAEGAGRRNGLLSRHW